MHKSILGISQLAILAATAFVLPGQAMAQDAPQAAASTGGDDIVVTARRREERLQDVPVAITALSGDALQARGIISTTDLVKTTPGLNITASNRGNSSPNIILRGQRVIDTSMVLDPPIIFYVNDVPYLRINGLNQAFYDIDNVQVLRGPQGTLFGKSTTGGAILVNTARANTDKIEGYLKATGGNYNLWRGEGAINVPLNEYLAVRLAGTIARRDGYVHARNVPGYDMNNEHYDSQRLSIRYKKDAVTNDLVASRFSGRSHGSGNPVWIFNPGGSAAGSQANKDFFAAAVARDQGDFYGIMLDTNSNTGFLPSSKEETWDISNTTNVEINDHLSVKNTIAYRHIDAPFNNDLDGSNLFLPAAAGDTGGQEFYSFTKVHQFSDELQLQGTSDKFDWILGAFYMLERGIDGTTSFQGGTPTTGRFSTVAARNISYSGFVSGTYRFGLDGLSISAGARISHDDRFGEQQQYQRNITTGAIACQFTLTSGAKVCTYPIQTALTEPSWSVSLNYKPSPELLIYLAHRHGYRTGGVQNRATTQISAVPFGPEKVNDIELGVKVDKRIGGDANIIVNADVYRGAYKGLQRSVPFNSSAGTPVNGFTNAGSAIIQGLEAEATLRVGGLEVSGNVGYTDAFYRKYTQQLTSTVSQDLSFLDLGFVPKWTVQARASYTLPLSHDGESAVIGISYQSMSSTFTSEVPMPAGAYLPKNHSVDARLAWNKVMGSPVDLNFLVTNLTREKYHTYSVNFSNSFGYAVRYPAPPRRWEVSATYRF
ncbi:TonB-dependent receptor [Novosphingobium bradum]|uniref:TonB-dependent receptor n=1 Tax=Novosphingobium bradum TaxID=1737444 RepID=A0ABV7IJ81_9SPHN